MRQSRLKIASVVADATLTKGFTKRYSRQLAAYLLSERRVGELDSLMRDVQADWANQGYVEVIALSAFKLSLKTIIDIKRQIRGLYPNAKQIVVTEQLDPSVIGGVKLKLADQQLDLSIAAKLNQFKQLTTNEKE